MKPKTIYTGDRFSGVDITYTKSRGMLSIGGWYDECVGIGNQEVSLKDFLEQLGIDEKELKKRLTNKSSVI